MLFNSIDFIFFFPLVYVLYGFFCKKLTLRNIFILSTSYIFYGWWDWRFLFLIIISSFVDFYIGKRLGKEEDSKKRKHLLYLSLLVNLGFLMYFKYFNFFVESFVDAFSLFGKQIEISALNIILPVGISFYTFQTLSYTIDIYRRKLEPTHNIVSFFVFVAFFPQLVAGPIERASHLLPQFSKIHRFNYNDVRSGFQLMLWGFFKKVVIADRLAILVNEVYNNPEAYSGFDFVIATVFFAFQIYCDFSGYSDIAIGLSKTMGFDLMKNFNTPYFSKSITEFWRRWHISLSTWFRDYVYIPLGGSRKGDYRTYFNLFSVFLISGLWHGAAMTFVIWGAIHGFIIVFEKITQRYRNLIFEKPQFKRCEVLSNIVLMLITFSIVAFAWIFFRANTFKDAIYIVTSIFTMENEHSIFDLGLSKDNLHISIVLITILLLIEYINNRLSIRVFLNNRHIILRWSVYLLVVFIILLYGVYGEDSPDFLYFQF